MLSIQMCGHFLNKDFKLYLVKMCHYNEKTLFHGIHIIVEQKKRHFSSNNVVPCFTEQESSNERSSQIITSKSLIMWRGLLKLITD